MSKLVYNKGFGGYRLSVKAINWMNENGLVVMGNGSMVVAQGDKTYFQEIPRHHPVLVKCVETLGKEAGEWCATLSVLEIEGTQYHIVEYDGFETVLTPENTPWVEVDYENL